MRHIFSIFAAMGLFAGAMLTGAALAGPPEVPGCSLSGITRADYAQFTQCLDNRPPSSLSFKCRYYFQYALAADCLDRAGQKFCEDIYFDGNTSRHHTKDTEYEELSFIDQIIEITSLCSLSTVEWVFDFPVMPSDAEIARKDYECIAPQLAAFQAQHGC